MQNDSSNEEASGNMTDARWRQFIGAADTPEMSRGVNAGFRGFPWTFFSV